MSEEKVVLVFPEIEEESKAYVSVEDARASISMHAAPLEERNASIKTNGQSYSETIRHRSGKNWFKGYKVDSIEIWLKTVLKSEGVTKLILSAEGEGGMKITLKPEHKAQQQSLDLHLFSLPLHFE